MKTINELTNVQSYMIAPASYISFVVMALFVSILFVAALGIANALVWPAIWPLTLEGLGKFTKTRSALLIMAISGGAIIPPLSGRIIDANKQELITNGIQEIDALAIASLDSYWILIPCYVIILMFAVWGHKIKSWNK